MLVYCSKEFRSRFSDSLSGYTKAQPFFNFGLVLFIFFELGLNDSGLGLTIFHKMSPSPSTHLKYL